MLKKLTKITDVQVGDYFPRSEPSFSTPLLTTVDEIVPEHNLFSYSSSNGYLMGNVREDELKQVVLLRKTSEGIDVLAGEEAYKQLQLGQTREEKTKPEARKSQDAQFPHYPGMNPNDPDGPYNRPDGH